MTNRPIEYEKYLTSPRSKRVAIRAINRERRWKNTTKRRLGLHGTAWVRFVKAFRRTKRKRKEAQKSEAQDWSSQGVQPGKQIDLG